MGIGADGEAVSFATMRELTNLAVPDTRDREILMTYVNRAEAAARIGDCSTAPAASRAYQGSAVAWSLLPRPPVSPLSVVFVGGWGSSMYQSAFD